MDPDREHDGFDGAERRCSERRRAERRRCAETVPVRRPMPRRPMRLAEYLYYAGRVPWRAFAEALTWQRRQRPPIGRIAVGWGHLGAEEVRELLARRRREGASEPFGEYAKRLGLLTPVQVVALLGRQRGMQRPIGQYFVERGLLEPNEIEALCEGLARHNDRCRSPGVAW